MEKKIVMNFFKSVLFGIFCLLLASGCQTRYGGIKTGSEKTVTIYSASCSPYGCIDFKELSCEIEAGGDLSCVNMKENYVNQ